MITVDLTMPIHIINMLLLIVVMNAVLYRPIRSILIERSKKIADLEKEIETFEKNSRQRLEEFDKKMAGARGKAKAEIEAVKAEAVGETSEKLAGVRSESDADKADQLGKLGKQVAAAQKSLKGQLDTFAGEMASKILGRAAS